MAIMKAPPSGVKVRMYRHGHGDCYLLAFAGREGTQSRNVYVMIDCGLKPGSEIHRKTDPDNYATIHDIVDDIHASTGGEIDVVAITHEHQDHVNAFSMKKNGKNIFDKIKFRQCWLGWTEDETDELANSLRERFRDTLVALSFAQKKMASLNSASSVSERLSDLLSFEIGDEGKTIRKTKEGLGIVKAFESEMKKSPLALRSELAARSIKGISNKKAMKYIRDKAQDPIKFLGPNSPPQSIPFVEDVKAYVLGPPRDQALLLDLDPIGNEEFHLRPSDGTMALHDDTRGFALAVTPELDSDSASQPFSPRYRISGEQVSNHHMQISGPIDRTKREKGLDYIKSKYEDPALDWRRIDDDWLGTSEGLALRLNNEVNNTSLVLAFELGKTGKVLLFTGDAQRGSWIGWSDLQWTTEDCETTTTTTVKDLLSRCVFYKVGHHGSHNATLNGSETDEYANIGWMARGKFANDFVAMIPANTEWALSKSKPWRHPLPEIEEALHKKAYGRVFRADLDHVEKPAPSVLSNAKWT